jgi:hypothetical protein
MPEVNEVIVKQYLELRGYFVITNAKFLRKKEDTGKKSSGWGDVDILATHPNGSKYLIEVKGWHMQSFTPSDFGGGPYVDVLAKNKAEETFQTRDFKTILVVPEIGSKSKSKVMELATQEGIDEVWEFPTILNFLINQAELNMNYGGEVLQMLRLLKQYLFLPLQILQVRVPESELDDEMEKFGFHTIYDGSQLEKRLTCFKKVTGDWRWVEVRNLSGNMNTQPASNIAEDERDGVITDIKTLRKRLNELLT